MLTERIRDECLEGLNEKKFAHLMASFEVMPKNQKQADMLGRNRKEPAGLSSSSHKGSDPPVNFSSCFGR